MQLDRIAARIRPRTPWEGIDLGFTMARQWFLPLWRLWWTIALPVATLLTLLLHNHVQLLTLLVWWFKPLYEPLLLFWLSRRLFDERLDWRQTLSHWRAGLLPHLLPNLLWRRLSPNRSFYMPVSHLEGLRGAARGRRCGVLSTRGSSAGAWLTVVGIHIETIWECSVVLLLLYMVPQELLPGEMLRQALSGESPWLSWLFIASGMLAMSVMAPFYVAGGFGIYLARRTELEGWDIEIAFRRMRPRFATTAIATLLTVVTLVLAPLPEAARAAPVGQEAVTREQARQAIDSVLKDDAFGRQEKITHWKYIGGNDDKTQVERHTPVWAQLMANLVEVLFWIAAGGLVIWLAYYLARLFDFLPQRTANAAADRGPKPTLLFGLPVTPESLPADVPAAARQMAAEGRVRPALALLYRATLIRLIHDHHLRIPESATEGECRRLVAAERPEPESGYFRQLTRTWIGVAYGHLAPEPATVEELCTRWQHLYGGTGNA